MLYTLSYSPWHYNFNYLKYILHVEDDILLMQDGVFAAINNNYLIKILINSSTTVYALREDIKARGLISLISNKINIINYADFVNLTIKHVNQINW